MQLCKHFCLLQNLLHKDFADCIEKTFVCVFVVVILYGDALAEEQANLVWSKTFTLATVDVCLTSHTSVFMPICFLTSMALQGFFVILDLIKNEMANVHCLKIYEDI